MAPLRAAAGAVVTAAPPCSTRRCWRPAHHAPHSATPCRATPVTPCGARSPLAPQLASPRRARSRARPRASAAAAAAAAAADAPSGGPRVVVVGGGFGGLYTALRLDGLPWPGGAAAQVTLVDRADRFLFKPLLYELLSGELTQDEVAPRFEELLAPTRVRFERAGVADVTPDLALRGAGPDAPPAAASVGGGRVRLEDGREVPYDYLVLALGADARAPPQLPGAAEHALPFATLRDAERVRDALDAAAARRGGAAVRCAVVGAGVGGVELAATLGASLRAGGDVALLATGDDILERGTDGQRSAARDALARAGVRVLLRSRVQAIEPPGNEAERSAAGDAPLLLRMASTSGADAAAPPSLFPADVVLWAGGAAPAAGSAICASLGADAAGALPTDDTLRLRGHECVFALGDVARVAGAALAPTAQVAFQAADYCAWNVWAAHAGRPLLPFRYQHLGDMMALGGADAAAVALPIGGATLEGPAAALLRRAAYVYRMPTPTQAGRVGAAWLQRGAQFLIQQLGAAPAPPKA